MKFSTPFLLRCVGWPLLTLAVLEFCARADDWWSHGAPFTGNYSHSGLWIHDELGQRGRPNGQYLKWKLNSAGFRSPEPNLDPRLFHVGVTGASETFGLYESEGAEWPRQLERRLNGAGGRRNFAVANMAWPGLLISTTRRHVPMMTAHARPKVMVIYGSPTSYLYRQHAPEEQKVKPPPTPPPGFQFRILVRTETIAKRVVPEVVQNWIRFRQIRDTEATLSEIYDRVPERVIELYEKDLTLLVRDLRAAGVEPVLVTHATLFGDQVQESDRVWLTLWRRSYPMLREGGFLDLENRANTAVKRIGAAEKVGVIDAAKRMPPGRANFADFVHFTDQGSAVFADLVAEKLACLAADGNVECLRP